MKLRNKKTGEIENWCIDKDVIRTCDGSIVYNSLAELNDEWEDYKEPKKYWYISRFGYIDEDIDEDFDADKTRKEIGNYFETEEEAEKAVEKLKAWKRLKDKRFERVFNLELGDALCGGKTVEFKLLIDDEASIEDIKLLFGGEE